MAVSAITSRPKRTASVTRIKMGSAPIHGTLHFSQKVHLPGVPNRALPIPVV
jgi:hypothetical protein